MYINDQRVVKTGHIGGVELHEHKMIPIFYSQSHYASELKPQVDSCLVVTKWLEAAGMGSELRL